MYLADCIVSLVVSYRMIVLYIRERGGSGFYGQNNHQLHKTILTPWQYWLGITKPKSAFSTTLNASNRLLQLKKKFFYSMEFSTD